MIKLNEKRKLEGTLRWRRNRRSGRDGMLLDKARKLEMKEELGDIWR